MTLIYGRRSHHKEMMNNRRRSWKLLSFMGGGGGGIRNQYPKANLVSRDRANRVSFVPSKRPSWNRSLAIRGRESIIVAVGEEFRPQPKQKGGRKIPNPGRGKKAVQGPTDFRKEKAYFQEVDSFELLEESPSPKQFSTWAMGRQHDYSFRVCQGSYDSSLINSWEEWDMKHGSENDHPKEFSENQYCCRRFLILLILLILNLLKMHWFCSFKYMY